MAYEQIINFQYRQAVPAQLHLRSFAAIYKVVAAMYAHQLRRGEAVGGGQRRAAPEYGNGKIHKQQTYMKNSGFTSTCKFFLLFSLFRWL
jgi:hypothetical protein